jgi:hypothetical protein
MFIGNKANQNEVNLERTNLGSIVNSSFEKGSGRYIYGWKGNLEIIGSNFSAESPEDIFEGQGRALYSKD